MSSHSRNDPSQPNHANASIDVNGSNQLPSSKQLNNRNMADIGMECIDDDNGAEELKYVNFVDDDSQCYHSSLNSIHSASSDQNDREFESMIPRMATSSTLNANTKADDSPITPMSAKHRTVDDSFKSLLCRRDLNRSEFRSDEAQRVSADKSKSQPKLRFNESQIEKMIKEVARKLEMFRYFHNKERLSQDANENSHWKHQQFFHSGIMLLRVLGRKCELMGNEQGITCVDILLTHYGLSEFARSGVSSHDLQRHLKERGQGMCYSPFYTTTSQLPALDSDIRDFNAFHRRFTSNYSFQRTSKYIAALKRYEEEVLQNRVKNYQRAQEIGKKLNRIAIYARSNQMRRIESKCRRRGLKIVKDLWNKMPMKFDTEHPMINSSESLSPMIHRRGLSRRRNDYHHYVCVTDSHDDVRLVQNFDIFMDELENMDSFDHFHEYTFGDSYREEDENSSVQVIN